MAFIDEFKEKKKEENFRGDIYTFCKEEELEKIKGLTHAAILLVCH